MQLDNNNSAHNLGIFLGYIGMFLFFNIVFFFAIKILRGAEGFGLIFFTFPICSVITIAGVAIRAWLSD